MDAEFVDTSGWVADIAREMRFIDSCWHEYWDWAMTTVEVNTMMISRAQLWVGIGLWFGTELKGINVSRSMVFRIVAIKCWLAFVTKRTNGTDGIAIGS
jgi:hypothetical protein